MGTSTTSFIVTWDPPPEDEQNGVIVGYTVQLRRPGSVAVLRNTTATHYEFTSLVANTRYEVRVAARTSAGTGVYSSFSGAFLTPTTGEFSACIVE